MPRSLPSRPSLEYVRKEAKRLLAAHRNGDSSLRDVLRCLRRFAGASDHDMLAADVSLQEVQHALAQDYGFRSWARLRAFCAGFEPRQFGGLREHVLTWHHNPLAAYHRSVLPPLLRR